MAAEHYIMFCLGFSVEEEFECSSWVERPTESSSIIIASSRLGQSGVFIVLCFFRSIYIREREVDIAFSVLVLLSIAQSMIQIDRQP